MPVAWSVHGGIAGTAGEGIHALSLGSNFGCDRGDVLLWPTSGKNIKPPFKHWGMTSII